MSGDSYNPLNLTETAAAFSASVPGSLRSARPQRLEARTVLVAVNRKAGSGRAKQTAEQVLDEIRARGLQVEATGDIESLSRIARQLTSDNDLRAAVAIGGDGTAGALLNGTPPGTPIAVVPTGTENLLAKYTRNRGRPTDIGKLLDDGVVIQLDAGKAGGRLFALMISAGFDAEVVRQVHAQRDGNITHLAYAKPILNAVRKYPYPPMTVSWTTADGERGQTTGCWVFGVNLPRYAQGLPIVPEACGKDHLLDVCVFERGGTAAGLWYLWNVLRRRKQKVESVTSARCPSFRIESTADGVPYQLDGDPGGVLPVDVTVEPGRLSLLVSRFSAEHLGFDTSSV